MAGNAYTAGDKLPHYEVPLKFKQLHSWRISGKKAVQVQTALKKLLVFRKQRGVIRIIAGADISYDKQSERFFAGVVVFRLNGRLELIEECAVTGKARFPYIPGLLSFREGPILLRTFRKLKASPDVILFDGQGIAHPRNFGLASHIGLILDTPSIGCAKSRLVGEHGDVENVAGAYSKLIYKNKTVGVALRTKVNTKPIFVSIGHKITLASAISVVLRTCCGYRIPEPVRYAHLLVNKLRKQHLS
ncbi:MAG: nfi [Candidatus Brocadiaceae bacterium]|nr:nfi [Candidatus Brocadiaceae bacterium]